MMTAEDARALWVRARAEAESEGSIFDRVLYHVERSVLIDIIDKRMALSDTFAVTIGNRMEMLMRALSEE